MTMTLKHTYTELVGLTDSYSLNKDDWIFLQEIATSTQSTIKVCPCSKPLSVLKTTFHTFDSSKTYTGTHPASSLGRIYNRFKCNCCQVNMTALQFLKNYYKASGFISDANEKPLSLNDVATKRNRDISPTPSATVKRFNSYGGSSTLNSCQKFLFVPPDVSPLPTVGCCATSRSTFDGFLPNVTHDNTTTNSPTFTTTNNTNSTATFNTNTTTNTNSTNTHCPNLNQSLSTLDLDSLSNVNDNTNPTNTLTAPSNDFLQGSQSTTQALLTQPLMTQSLTSSTISTLATGSSIDSNLINSLLTTIIGLTKRIESLEGIISQSASLATSKGQSRNPTRTMTPSTKTITPSTKTITSPTKIITSNNITTLKNTNLSTKTINSNTINLPTSSVGNSLKQQEPIKVVSSSSKTWAFIASQPATSATATLAKEKAFASTTSDHRRDGLKTLRSLIKPQPASRPKQIKDEATTAIYIAGFEFIKYKQIWSALREAKFQVSRIHNIQWIGKTILEFVVASNYRAQFSSEMKVIGFKIKEFDPSVNKKASTPAECKMAKQAFVTRCVKNILYSKSPLTREFFKVAISKACSDAETKEIYDIEFSRGVMTKQESIARIVDSLVTGNLDQATYAGHIKELEGLDASHDLVSKYQAKKTTNTSTKNVESSSMDVDSNADVEAEEGALISEC